MARGPDVAQADRPGVPEHVAQDQGTAGSGLAGHVEEGWTQEHERGPESGCREREGGAEGGDSSKEAEEGWEDDEHAHARVTEGLFEQEGVIGEFPQRMDGSCLPDAYLILLYYCLSSSAEKGR